MIRIVCVMLTIYFVFAGMSVKNTDAFNVLQSCFLKVCQCYEKVSVVVL